MKFISIFVVLIFGLIVAVAPANSMVSGLAKADLAAGKNAINRGDYEKAIVLISRVIKFDGKNADAYNYLGFSYRKSGRLKKAAAAYKAALNIDPDHKGALEYQGELYLKMGNVKGARLNINHLTSLCRSGCRELSELKRALADYRATR